MNYFKVVSVVQVCQLVVLGMVGNNGVTATPPPHSQVVQHFKKCNEISKKLGGLGVGIQNKRMD